MEEKKRCIYLHRNKINGKSYVGQTVHQDNLEKRTYTDGSGYKGKNKNGNDSKFWRAIQKYGWDNFEHIILEKDIPTLELANEREKYWIDYYDSYNNGYNSTLGGDGARGRVFSEEEKEYRSKLYSGSGNPMYGKRGRLAPAYGRKLSSEQKNKISKANSGRVVSDETKKKLSDTRKSLNLVGEKASMYGRNHTSETKENLSNMAKERMSISSNREKISNTLKKYYETHDNPRKNVTLSDETKRKLSENHKGNQIYFEVGRKRGEQMKQSVNQYDLKGNFIKQYEYILDAEKETGASHTVIIKCCKRHKNSKTAGGFQWRYTNDCDDIGEVEYEKRNGKPKRVEQYSKEMELIKIWDSISEVERELGIKASNIITVCRGGRQKTAGGYIWRYADKKGEYDGKDISFN